MIIPDVELKKLVEQGYLPEGLNIGPSSVDLTLADSFSWPAPKQDQIVLGEAVHHEELKTSRYVLEPNHFVLASTSELIRVPVNMAAMWKDGPASEGWDCKSKMRVLSMRASMDRLHWSLKINHLSRLYSSRA